MALLGLGGIIIRAQKKEKQGIAWHRSDCEQARLAPPANIPTLAGSWIRTPSQSPN
jgi:hypothetical protein